MNRKQQEALRRAFAAPPPEGKSDFLSRLPRREIGCLAFVTLQARYIRKWVWGLFAVVLAAAFAVGRSADGELLWCLSALTPFFATALTAELGRSARYGMKELEMATRFSLRAVLLGRMAVLGLSGLMALALLLAFLPAAGSVLQMGLHLLVPYLLSALLGVEIVRRFWGPEGFYGTLAAGVMVSAAAMLAQLSRWEEPPLGWWLAAAVVLAAGTGWVCRNLLLQSEEYGWNYKSID